MPVPDIEACASYVYANRLIADRFTEEAGRLLEAAQTLEDIDERMRTADLIQVAEERAKMHGSIAELQERDMGVRCHCPETTRTSKTKADLDSLERAITTWQQRALTATR